MRRLAFIFIPLLFLACGREPAAPTMDGPSLSFMNNPDNGNPRFFRYESAFGNLLIDPTSRLFSIQADANRQFGCNGTPTLYSLADVQDILHNPVDPLAGQITELFQARDIYIAVFEDWDAWVAGGEDCADLFARKLAEGTGKIVYTDNDFFSFLRESSNANAFGFTAQGSLALLSGGTVKYRGVSRCVWDGEDGSRVFHCADRIDLR